ncbi:MAG: SMC-Scp complex subunit ScpB [Candidatus Nanoarchaeia archaeon]
MEMKKQIEALLFSAGRKLNVEELSRLLGTKASEGIINSIKELKEYYEKIDSPLKVVEYGDGWKMTVKEKYLPLVRSINPHTELSKTTMETLAVIAWKSPVLQSTVIKIRTNKAYDHINELEEMGFVTREKYGRTFVIKLSQKFFDYFDLSDKKDISKLFKDVKELAPDGQLKVDEFPGETTEKEDAQFGDDEKQIIDEISNIEKKEKSDSKN